MSNVFEDQKAFMRACGQTTDRLNDFQADMYESLMFEEYNEWLEAEPGTEDELDACIDLIVVTIGYMLSHGWDAQEAWKEVIRSNVAKIDPATGMVRRREDGKILKPEGWVPPDLSRFVGGGDE